MSYTRMTTAECYAFCEQPVRPAILATTRPDGRAHAAPIWFAIDGEVFVFNTDKASVKGRNLLHNPHLVLCVQDDRPPFSYVAIEGKAELLEDADLTRVWAARIGGRYMGADRADEFGARNGIPSELVVRVCPERIVGVSRVADP